MSTTVSTHKARAFRHASDIPDKVWDVLQENEAATNVVLAFAEKARSFPREGPSQRWIAVYDAENVKFVLSCTTGPLGNYPVFIVASETSAKEGEDLADSLGPLARCLLDEVPAQRVFSVFSAAKVTEVFAKILVAEAHARQQLDIEELQTPYYDASFASCTRETFNKSLNFPFPVHDESEDIVITLRRADASHLDGIKALCMAFSETSPPYELDDKRAELEAATMITGGQAWVHIVQPAGQAEEIACLVATTRESKNVVAVTKVFTAGRWRRRRCAERLLHRVCQDLFKTKKEVVLYVGNSEALVPARELYRKLGFQGLGQSQVVGGAERWLEIGFEGTTLGYW